jgi:hypothetical protein
MVVNTDPIPDINKLKKESNDILNLDINKDPEINFYKELNIKELADNTKKKDQILKLIAEKNLKNDTHDIDFYKDKTPPQVDILELSGIFCDNFILSGLTLTDRIKGKNCLDCGIYTTRTREFVRERQISARVKPVDITNPDAEDLTTERIKHYQDYNLKGGQIKGAFKIQNIKVATPDVPLKEIIQYTTPQHLKYLNADGLYLHDIDYTQDVAGCINKGEFINYLLNTGEGFYLSMDTIKTPHLKIMEDDHLRGKHCLTFLILKDGMLLRVKFYNKFIQSIESGSVRTSIGGHVADFVNNPEIRLKDTIKKGLQHGILRIEISYYCKENTPKEQDILEDLDYLKGLLKNAPSNAFFFCSIQDQHKQLLNNIHENIVIYDLTHKLMLFCRWWNSKTGKVNGILKKDVSQQEIRHTCAFLTFNKPFKLVLLQYNQQESETLQPESEEEPITSDSDEETEQKLIKNAKKASKIQPEKTHLISKDAKIILNVAKYDKINQPLTHLTDNTLYPHKTDKVKYNPETRGLTPNNGITWHIPDTAIKDNRSIKFIKLDNDEPLILTSKKAIKKIEKQLIEQGEEFKRMDVLKSLTKDDIQEERRQKAQELEQQLRRAGLNLKYANLKLHEQETGEQIEILGFYRMADGTYIIYDGIKQTTYKANKQLNNYLERVLENNYEVFNIRTKEWERAFYYLTHDLELIPSFYITVKEIKYTESKNKYALLDIKSNYKYLKESLKQEEQKTIKDAIISRLEIHVFYEDSVSRSIESVDVLEGDKLYYIKVIKKVTQKARNIYILYLLDGDKNPIYQNEGEQEYKPYKSNYYVEQYLNTFKSLDDLYNTNIIPFYTGAIKLTPNKKRCRNITFKI